MSKSKQQDPTIEEDDEAIPVGVETDAEIALTTNIYSEIRKRLVQRGIPEDEVAFIHDAKNHVQRAKLFDAVNKGKVRVLIGSTEKMGTGMNVQERCVALHTITPPWRPGDIEQQVGRVIRQGNLFPLAAHFIHVTECSFDAYTWQLLENKAGFRAQVSSGQVTDREIDDVDQTVVTFSEIKALAAGNPLIMQLVVLQAELSRLHAVRASWESSHSRVQGSIRTLEWQKQETTSRLQQIEQAIQHRNSSTTEKFSAQLKPTIDADTLEVETDRDAAGKHIRLLATHAAQGLLSKQATEKWMEIGMYRGFPLNATVSGWDSEGDIQLFFKAGPEILPISLNTDAGITRSMDIRLNSLDATQEDVREQVRVLEKKIKDAEADGGLVWEHEEKYLQLQAKVNDLNIRLNKDQDQSKAASALPVPDAVRKAVDTKSNTAREVQAALRAIRDMLSDPVVLARFAGSAPWTPQELGDEQVVEAEQTLFDSVILQFDLFGDTVAVSPKKQRCR
jgi:hypothetical protein